MLFISNERANIITDQNIQGAPDLVIEILSPGTEDRDLGEKKMLYARYGVKEYWIIWQANARIEVYRLGLGRRYGKPTLYEAGEELTTDLLPGFSLAVSSLYPHLK